ncbi:MAG: RIP metalloprotease RseP [Aquificae bacterium]|nr:RIP metalloprotease RseP [Aquificota bacterium]
MTLIAFLILVGILVWVHEFGHFLMAKLFRVRVEVFSIGFGPPVVRKQIGETVYQIALLPLGGYVKLYGEEENLNDPRAFSSKKPWQKILIALGGPLFNVLFTIFLFTVIYAIGTEVPKYVKSEVVVGYVEENSLASKLGIKPGDKIVRINGYEIKTWEDLRKALLELSLKGVKKTKIYVKRGDKILELELTLPQKGEGITLGIAPPLPPVVGKVKEGSPAHQVGIKEGDVIIAVNGKPVRSWYELVELIRKNGTKPVKLTIKRGDKIIEKTVVPAKDPKTGKVYLGIYPKIETIKERHPLPEAFELAVERTYELTVLTFKTLWGLITGKVSLKTLGGPIAIAQFAGQAAQSGFIPFLSMMAFISLQLAIFNLLPLPVLDGGLVLLFLIEWIRGEPLPDKFKEAWQRVGFALIIALTLFVFINDILRLLGVN